MFADNYFQPLKLIKNNHRSRLSDTRLERCVSVATSSIPADIDQIVLKKQCQIYNFQVNSFFCSSLVCFYFTLKFEYEIFTFFNFIFFILMFIINKVL